LLTLEEEVVEEQLVVVVEVATEVEVEVVVEAAVGVVAEVGVEVDVAGDSHEFLFFYIFYEFPHRNLRVTHFLYIYKSQSP
jgi:hypothetical protein